MIDFYDKVLTVTALIFLVTVMVGWAPALYVHTYLKVRSINPRLLSERRTPLIIRIIAYFGGPFLIGLAMIAISLGMGCIKTIGLALILYQIPSMALSAIANEWNSSLQEFLSEE